jgi:hypothetical protein
VNVANSVQISPNQPKTAKICQRQNFEMPPKIEF